MHSLPSMDVQSPVSLSDFCISSLAKRKPEIGKLVWIVLWQMPISVIFESDVSSSKVWYVVVFPSRDPVVFRPSLSVQVREVSGWIEKSDPGT